MIDKSPPILKITRPAGAGALPRERLFRCLDSGREYPITWISGPAGCGKTTLVASYLDARNLPSLWYQVDERDGDIATFFYYLGIAAKKVSSRKRKLLPLFTPEYTLGMPAFTRGYFEALYTCFRTPLILVLDNYQDVPLSSKFHEMIKYGLESIAEGINVFVLSRREPPLEMARLRANNMISFLGWEEIRFSLEETREMMQMKGDRRIPDEVLFRLHQKTEGWAAGLMLVHLGSRIRKIDPPAIEEFPTKEVFDYFATEIFGKIDGETQEFSLKTAILPTVTSRVSEKLTGAGASEQVLSNLCENHYFTHRHSHSSPVYQYHPLFRDFLLARARDSYSSEELTRIQRSAALILEESGQEEDAVKLFAHGKDWDNLARSILNRARHLMAQGRAKTLQEWIEFIPEDIRESQPWLLYWLGTCKQLFSPAENVGPLFERALNLFRGQKDARGIFLAWNGIFKFYTWRDCKLLDYWLEWFYEHIHHNLPYPSLETEAEVTASIASSLSYRRPQHPDMQMWLERSISLSQKIGNDSLRTFIWLLAGAHYQQVGNLAKINRVIEEVERGTKSSFISPSVAIASKSSKATLYHFMNGDPELPLKLVREGLEMAQTTGIYVWNHQLLVEGARCCLDKGDLAGAAEFLQEMETWASRIPRAAFMFRFTKAWFYLLSGEIRPAVENAEIARKLIFEIGYPYYDLLSRLQMIQLLHIKGEHPKALEQLHNAGEIIKELGYPNLEYRFWMIKALLSLDRGEETSGLEFLRKAMELGREQGYMHRYGLYPAGMARLCARALEEGIEVKYVQTLICKSKLLPDSSPLEIEKWPWPLKIYTLGQFELERYGEPIRFNGKVQQKPLLLLKALIALGGKDVREEQLADLLWPEADGDAAHSTFKSNLSRLRHLLIMENGIQFQEGKAALDPRYCWVDAWAFERICNKVEAGLKEKEIGEPAKGNAAENQKKAEKEEIMRLAEKAIGLYKGHFLQGSEKETWTVSYRERLRNKFLRLIIKSGVYRQKNEQWGEAVEYYQKALEVDELAEEFYQHLMICHQQLGQHAEAFKVYRRCRDTLSAVLGIDPSPRTETIHKNLTANRRNGE